MITPPTDRLYKFVAIGGIVLAAAGGAGALRMYHETGIQQAEFLGTVWRVGAVYNRFVPLAREQIARSEKLKSDVLTPTEREVLQIENQKFREMGLTLDKEFEEALSVAKRQEAMTRHFRQMQAIWLVLAGAAISIGTFLSYRGFKVWLAQTPDADSPIIASDLHAKPHIPVNSELEPKNENSLEYVIEQDVSKRDSFAEYKYRISRDGKLIALYWHDYRGEEHGIEFVDGIKESWPVGRMTDFIKGGGPHPLILSERAMVYLNQKLA